MQPLSFLFVIDPIDSLNPAHDTSVALIEQAQAAGHRILVTSMQSLSVRSGRCAARCHEVKVRAAELRAGRWVTEPNWFELGTAHRRFLDEVDAVFVRTDPPVDHRYLRGTYLLDLVDQSGTVLVNSPTGLRDANEKLFALQFPELCPETLVSCDSDEIMSAIKEWGAAVLKPTDGMAGRGVLLLEPDDSNVRSMLEVATGRWREQVVVQRYLHECSDGDRRVIILAGEPIGAVRRIAAPGEFRCNMAAGARAVADTVTEGDREICASISSRLAALGLVFSGIDVIGGKLIEVNVTSPTGIREIEALSGEEVAKPVIDWTVRQVLSRR